MHLLHQFRLYFKLINLSQFSYPYCHYGPLCFEDSINAYWNGLFYLSLKTCFVLKAFLLQISRQQQSLDTHPIQWRHYFIVYFFTQIHSYDQGNQTYSLKRSIHLGLEENLPIKQLILLGDAFVDWVLEEFNLMISIKIRQVITRFFNLLCFEITLIFIIKLGIQINLVFNFYFQKILGC